MQISNTGDALLSSDFELYSIEELEQIGEFTWHIADHFPKNSTVTVFGASGVGKSFLCLDMAMSIANGVPYLNKWGTKQGNVLYLCSEGGYGVKGRIAAWNKWRSLKPTKNINFSVTSHDLQNRAEVERLLRKTKEKFKTIDAVFVDTLSRTMTCGYTFRTLTTFVSKLGQLWLTSTTQATQTTEGNEGQNHFGTTATRRYASLQRKELLQLAYRVKSKKTQHHSTLIH